MKKNGLGAALLALLLVFGLTGCSDGGNTETPPPDADIIISGIPKTDVVSIDVVVNFTHEETPGTVLAAASIIGALANGDPIDRLSNDNESGDRFKALLTLYEEVSANEYYNNGASAGTSGQKPMPTKKEAMGNGTVEATIRAVTDWETLTTEVVGKKKWLVPEFKLNLVLKWDEGTDVDFTSSN